MDELNLYVVTIIDISGTVYSFMLVSTDEYVSRDVRLLVQDNGIREILTIKTELVRQAVRPLTNETFNLVIEKEY